MEFQVTVEYDNGGIFLFGVQAPDIDAALVKVDKICPSRNGLMLVAPIDERRRGGEVV